MSSMSYNEAALELGVDHHYVRMLVSRGVIEIHHREEVRPNVLKVFVTTISVMAYKESHKVRSTIKLRVTPEEEAVVKQALEEYHGAHR